MNNVGEAFFNGPIDPFDLSKDWAPSDDDQRHRLVVHGAISSPSGPGGSGWRRLIEDFQLSGIVQLYSGLPFNITSGATTVQGTSGRPIVDGTFIGRNTGRLDPIGLVNLRLLRSIPLRARMGLDLMVEVFNATNRRNVMAVNTNFGAGPYPSSPSASFGQVTAVGDPRAVQLGVRVRF
jgi:hypothetical protein